MQNSRLELYRAEMRDSSVVQWSRGQTCSDIYRRCSDVFSRLIFSYQRPEKRLLGHTFNKYKYSRLNRLRKFGITPSLTPANRGPPQR